MIELSCIPEELIRLKAHQIWKERQLDEREGTPQSDWQEAKQYLDKHWREVFWWKFRKRFNKLGKLIERIARKGIRVLWKLLSFPFWLLAEPLSRDFALEIVKTLGIGFTAFGLLFSVWEGLEDRRLTQDKLITERFSKSVEQLGKEKDITVRIGGIYALERIAKDSDNDFWTIMEVLTSYVRENSSLPLGLKQYPKNEREWEDRQKKLEGLKEVSIDVQAVLTVIGRREDPKFGRDESIDLSLTNLQGANLRNANLQNSYLMGVNLQNSSLWGANLQGADLREANLQDAFLLGVNLQYSYLWGANLQNAHLWRANLQNAHLVEANLENANLEETDLQNASLWGANLQKAILIDIKNLTLKQIKLACFWDRAIYKGKLDREVQAWVAIEPENTNYIEKLKNDSASDPYEPIDCSRWEK